MKARSAVPAPLKLPKDAVAAELRAIGGPMPLFDMAEGALREPCRQYPLHLVLPLLAEWASADVQAERHWPWISGACYWWADARLSECKPSPLRPTDINHALHRIARNAEAISDDLHTFLAAAQSRVPADGEQPAQIDQLLACLAVAIDPGDAEERPLTILMDFDRRLVGAAAAADGAARVLNPGSTELAAFARKKSPADPALADFVGVLAIVWRSLSGRHPSTRKVQTASGEAPAFVLFVQAAAGLVIEKHPSEVKPPTLDAIAAALKSTAIPSEK